MISKTCLICKHVFQVKPARKDTAKFCSSKCHYQFGHTQAARDKMRIAKIGLAPWNKGVQTGFVPTTAFKRGHQTWNKGAKCEYARGEKNRNWKGGLWKTKLGYLMRSCPDHPNKRNYEHRLVIEGEIGRYLSPDEIVHHINGNKTDNHPQNLQVMSRSEHSRLHKGQPY